MNKDKYVIHFTTELAFDPHDAFGVLSNSVAMVRKTYTAESVQKVLDTVQAILSSQEDKSIVRIEIEKI